MILSEFKEQSEDYQTLRVTVPSFRMAILLAKVVEAAYQAGLEHGTTRVIMAGKK